MAGSTRLCQAHPAAMSTASRRLAGLLDDLADEHRGHRPREQGEGDNLVAVFPVATDAVAFAVALDEGHGMPIDAVHAWLLDRHEAGLVPDRP